MHFSRKNIRLLALTLLAAVTLAGTTGWANAIFLYNSVDNTTLVFDELRTNPALIETDADRAGDAVLAAGTAVVVEYNGNVFHTTAEEESAGDLLERLDIVPGALDMIGVRTTLDTVTLTVADQFICYEQVTETAPFTTARVATAELPMGTERVIRPGVNGVHTAVYEQVWSSGELISRQFVEELSTTVVGEIVEYGTAVDNVSADDTLKSVKTAEDGSGILTFKSGATMKFSQAKAMTATAYTSGHAGVGTITASGTTARVGAVAVDKSVIPLGTRMFIVTNSGIVYGMAVAEDTGVRGNKVDLYYDTYEECINFGRRACTVYILE